MTDTTEAAEFRAIFAAARREREQRSIRANAVLDSFLIGAGKRLAAIKRRHAEEDAAGYVRERDLPRLLRRIDPDFAGADHAAVIFVLTQDLLREQRKASLQRGEPHWSEGPFDADRVGRLRAAIIAERRAMEERDEASGRYAEVDARMERARQAEIDRRFPQA